MANPTYEFQPGSLGRNLRNFDGDINALVAGVVDFQGDRAVAAMKVGAPWTDRTGNARATLGAYGLHTDSYHELHLHGGMPYQIWLEIRFAGRYAVIGPAVKFQGLALMNRLRSLVNKLGSR